MQNAEDAEAQTGTIQPWRQAWESLPDVSLRNALLGIVR